MTRITFDLNNAAEEESIRQFAKRMNIPFQEKKIDEFESNDNNNLLKILMNLSIPANESSFGDACEFQRSERKDKAQPNRQ